MEFAPGTDYKYCNTNTVLLGMVVEKISGLSLADYLQQNIFDPLGLDATSYPPNGLMPLPYSQGYNKAPDGTVFDAALWNPSWGNAAGVIVSNAADMTTWAAALGKGTLLRPGTQEQRISDGTEAHQGSITTSPRMAGSATTAISPGMRRWWCICPNAMPRWWSSSTPISRNRIRQARSPMT